MKDQILTAIETKLETFAHNNEPDFSIENDGIGAYEYWGARGFDHGTNYAEIAADDLRLVVDVSVLLPEDIEDIIETLKVQAFGYHEDYIECKRGNNVNFHANFEVVYVKVKQDIMLQGTNLVIDAEWVTH